MHEQKDRNLKMFNEMDPTMRKMNIHGISAFEAAEAKASTVAIPGFEKDNNKGKNDFRRYASQNKINYEKSQAGKSIIGTNQQVPPLLPGDAERTRHVMMGRIALQDKPAQTARQLPSFNERSNKNRSSVNYEDLAGQRKPS